MNLFQPVSIPTQHPHLSDPDGGRRLVGGTAPLPGNPLRRHAGQTWAERVAAGYDNEADRIRLAAKEAAHRAWLQGEDGQKWLESTNFSD